MKDIYLVTGATGFVGANLVRKLVKQKKSVSIIVRDKKLNFRLKDIASKINIYEGDITKQDIDKIIDKIKPTIIYHLAAYGVPLNHKDSNKMIDVNIKGTLNIINSVKRYPFKLFINTGTFSEYGVKKNPIKETDFLIPVNDYGITKAAATLFAQKIAIRENLPIITFRLFYVYGYYELNRLISTTILSALKNNAINVTKPKYVRDFIFVDDVIDVFIRAKNADFSPGSIYNIGYGHQHSLKEAVDIIIKKTNSHSKVIWGGFESPERHKESKKSEADIRQVRKIFNWKPKYHLEAGLEKTIKWFKSNLELYDEKK